MIKVLKPKFVASLQAVEEVYPYLIYKDKSHLALMSESLSPLASTAFPYYVSKIIASHSNKIISPLNTVFSQVISLYSLPSLRLLASLTLPTDSYLKDALFTADDTQLVALVDTKTESAVESQLLFYDTETYKMTSALVGMNYQIASIALSPNKDALILYTYDNRVLFFLHGNIIKEVKLSSFQKAFFIEKGLYFLTDAPLGMNLYSASGKRLSHLNFIINKTDKLTSKNSEHYQDFLYVESIELIFYVSEVKEGEYYNLYVFSSVDFSLQFVKLRIKEAPVALFFLHGFLGYKTAGGIYFYQVIKQD